MESEKEKYAAFMEKVKRTVYVDNLSPQVTEPVLRTALNQFGNVEKVQILSNFTEERSTSCCALVEMQTSKQAKQIVAEMQNLPFMISGMPRPVRVSAAEIAMFNDRPRKPGRKITCRWLEPKDPDFQVAKKLKILAQKHAAEASFLLKHQLEEEEKLANQQEETLKAHYKKFEQIDEVLADGTATCLARHYDMKGFSTGF